MKHYENLKIGWRQSVVPSLPFKNKALVIAAKNYARLDLKVVCLRPILLNFFTLSHHIFARKSLLFVAMVNIQRRVPS